MTYNIMMTMEIWKIQPDFLEEKNLQYMGIVIIQKNHSEL